MKAIVNLKDGWCVVPNHIHYRKAFSFSSARMDRNGGRMEINIPAGMIFYCTEDKERHEYVLPEGVTFQDIIAGIENCKGEFYYLP